MTVLQFNQRHQASNRQQLKTTLIRYRDDILAERYGYNETNRDEGILRRSMLEAILETRPETPAEFITLIPLRMIRHTCPKQLKAEISTIVDLVRRS